MNEDQMAEGRPWANHLLILLNGAVYFLQSPAALGTQALSDRTLHLWSFIGYSFIHLNVAHLVSNLLVLFVLGPDVNRRLGHIGYLAFYLAAAAAAGLGFILSGGQSVVGASGAAGAVMAAFMVLFPRARLVIWRGLFAPPAVLFVIFYFLYNLVMTLVQNQAEQQVAYQAHLAGMLFGFAVTVGLQLARLLPREPWDLMGLLSRWKRRSPSEQGENEAHDRFDFSYGQGEESAQRSAAMQRQAAALRAGVSAAVAQRNLSDAAALFRQLRAIDPRQFLPRQAQIDVANQLASEQRYVEAAEAYEQFLEHYSGFEQIEEVQLMLGIIYSRYLNYPSRARECLNSALVRLKGPTQIEMARSELRRIDETARR